MSETGECLPDLLLIPALCAALRLSADELLEIPPQTTVKGTALVKADSFRVATPSGISLTAMGAQAMEALRQTDVSALCELLADKNALHMLRALGFTATASEGELAKKCNLTPEATRDALFHLLRLEICQCTADGYVLGANAYLAYAALTAAYLASPSGRSEVTSIATSYST